MFAPYVEGPETSRDMITTFGGYNHNLRNADGLPTSQWGSTPPMEWYDEENLCTDQYPVMSPATTPTMVKTDTELIGMTSFTTIDGAEHYAYMSKSTYVDHLWIDNEPTNLTLTHGIKQFVLMGTYLLIFPDALYINVNDPTEYGSAPMEVSYNITPPWSGDMGHAGSTWPLYVTPCDADGNAISGYTTSDTAPSNPSDGDLWLDTSEETHIFKRYSASYGMWLGVSDVYALISNEQNDLIGKLSKYFKEGDGVSISYTTTSPQNDNTLSLNGSHVIQKVVDNGILVIGVIDAPFTITGLATVTRSIPEMDYVIECNNRIWGCKFGVVDGKNINEIYCSKLGDFKNWETYEGLSTDAWRASVGAEGEWTGAVAYNGYPTFFKANSIHKVYISSTGAHQIVMTSADGVADGSWRSLVVINGVLFYLGHFGVMAYTGTLPTKVSEQIPYVLSNGVAGGLNKYYYLSANGPASTPMTFVYDTELHIWHKLTPHRADMYTNVRRRLMYEELPADPDTYNYGNIKEVETRNWDMEEVYGDWYAVSGVIGFAYPDNKYLSRFVFRMDMDKDSQCEMFIEYDSDGQWHSKGRMYRPGLQSFVLPVMPRRCDHCRIKLVGNGNFRLYSISKVLEVGSDY